MKLNEAYIKYTQKMSSEFLAQVTEISQSRKDSLRRANQMLYTNAQAKIKEEEVVLS